VDDLVERGYHPLAYRYFVLNAHYRSKLNFTWDALGGAQRALERLWQRARDLALACGPPDGAAEEASAEAAAGAFDESPEVLGFTEAVGIDLGTPQATALLWQLAGREANPRQTLGLMLRFDRVLALSLDAAARGRLGPAARDEAGLPAEVTELVRAREEARAARQWPRADALRARLGELGYLIEDTPGGPRVRPGVTPG
jgi:cysteinyl-tRNA synthetase